MVIEPGGHHVFKVHVTKMDRISDISCCEAVRTQHQFDGIPAENAEPNH